MGKKNKSENVQVIVRVRPMNEKERNRGDKEAVKLDLAANNITVEGADVASKTFGFDAVYNNSFSQKDVYLQSIHAVVETVLQGFNATIFAYGQSGTGKTYSMAGVLSDPKQQGIIPNALNHIFDTIRNLSTDNMEYSVMASFVELYNGKCRDLLVDGRANLELKENQAKQFFVKDLTHHVVKDTMEAMKLMDAGLARREVKSTDLNADSSRSHSLFSVYVRTHDKVNDVRTESKLNLVDLAGSERQKQSGATGETLNEGNNINQSLTALGMVIDCLVKGKPHIPYRSSPLTMLLKDGLGGNSRTVIVGTCSPGEGAAHETVSSLRFLDRAKQIKNKPTVQMDPKDAKIAELQEEVKSLRARLGLGKGDDADEGGEGDDAAKQNYIKSFDTEVEKLRNRVEELEVQAHLASEAEESARADLASADAKIAAVRREYEEKLTEMKAEMARANDEMELKTATEGASNEELAELIKVCAHFIETHDADGQWKPLEGKKAKKGKEPKLTIDDISSGFRLLDCGSFDKKVGLARKSSIVSPPKPPKQKDLDASSANPPPTDTPPLSKLDPGVSDEDGVSRGVSPAMEGTEKKSKKDKKDKKDKKEKKEKKSKKEAGAVEMGLLPPEQVQSVLQANSVEFTPAVQAAVAELLEQQREQLQNSVREKLQSDGAALESPEAAQQLLAAYEAMQEDFERAKAQLAKQKSSSAKVKEIAEKRATEVEHLKQHVDALREELNTKHGQHAAELALQQDQLVTQHNKRTEQLMAKHQKALVKEKKQREKLSEQIHEWEDKYAKLEQEYDVKIMEYEALQQNYEQQKIEQLKKYRDMAQGYSAHGGMAASPVSPGMVAASHDTDRLRRAVAKANAGVAALNSNYNPHANDGRFQAKSAPEPDLPSLPGSDPRPPGGHAPSFSRNFLDVPQRR